MKAHIVIIKFAADDEAPGIYNSCSSKSRSISKPLVYVIHSMNIDEHGSMLCVFSYS